MSDLDKEELEATRNMQSSAEKTADEMMFDLGYTEINTKTTYIEYLDNASWGAYERIKFDLKQKRVLRDARTGQHNKAIRYVSLEELQAINKKCEELNWLDE